MARRAKGKKSKVGFFTKLLILLLAVALGWQLRSLHIKLNDAKIQQQQLTAQIEKKEQENDALQSGIKSGGSKEEIEKIARTELGLVAQGEKVFYDVSN